MAFDELKLKHGNWLAVDCGSMKSDNNCSVVIAAPESQKEDLIDAAAEHAADKHGHTNNEALHRDVARMVKPIHV